MPNPLGSDVGREWIELSNPYCEDVSKIKLFENNINHNIVLYRNGSCDYPIICNDCSKLVSEYNIFSQLYESSFTLNNNGEYVALKYGEITLDWINYSVVPEGYSLTKYDEWITTTPTPGYHLEYVLLFNITNATQNSTYNNTLILNNTETQNNTETSNNTYILNNTDFMNQTDIYNITNSTPIPDTINETNNTQNKTINISDDVKICNISIGIKLKEEKQIYENKESIKFYNTLNITPYYKSNFSIEYWVEDLYGTILKSKIQTTNLNEKTFTPNIKEKVSAIIIKNNLINIESNCSENILNDGAEKILIIKNPYYEEKKCEVAETNVQGKDESKNSLETSFIDTKIDEKNIIVNAYRGNDRKYSVNIQIKNNQNKKTTEIKLYLEKNSFTELFFPLKNLECGNYTITTEGLGYKTTEYYNEPCADTEVTSKGNSAKNFTLKPSNNLNSTKFNSTGLDAKFYNSPITGKTVYASRNEQTKKYSLIGIIIIFSSTITYFSYKYLFKK
ncbi:MAG: hypothetical protein QXK76_01525 [Candidatus Woesearchaeota archaeon]